MNDAFDVTGKVALVTGGRRGLGRALGEGLARAGAKLAVVSASADDAGLGESVRAACGEYLYLQADLADRGARAGLVDRVVERFGRLDVLVNNAGIQHREPAVDFAAEAWDRVLGIMLTAVFDLSQQAARAMLATGGGKIVNIASLLSFQGGWTVAGYAAAKHGVAGLTKALANEWSSKGINVNAIAPGYFDTDMCAAIKSDPVREPQIRGRIPAGRWGQPEDLVGPLLFLASDASRYVHGHVLVVDGGWLGR
jgi:2-deoxy-D-gluconate 3-dehydrogenase